MGEREGHQLYAYLYEGRVQANPGEAFYKEIHIVHFERRTSCFISDRAELDILLACLEVARS